MKILWIDDDRLYVRPLAEDMEDLGYEVERVWQVEEGYEKIRDFSVEYDLILIDVMMAAKGEFACDAAKGGKRTGLVLLTKIRDFDAAILQKVRVVTVVSDPQVKEFAHEMGVVLHLKSLTSAEKILGLQND